MFFPETGSTIDRIYTSSDWFRHRALHKEDALQRRNTVQHECQGA